MKKNPNHTMKKNPNHLQQGDVILLLADKLPDGCKPRPRENGNVVLAHGEATGHWHGTDSANVLTFDAPDGTVWVQNTGTLTETLKHAEHGPVTLPPRSVARFDQVREKDWFTMMERKVRD